mgnify:FL=1
MPNEQPLFSILIPTTGRADLFRMAIRSVREQTFPDWELVIADSSGSDGARMAATESGDRRIRYALVPPGRGPLAPWDYAASQARGTYVLWLDDDNYLLPFALDLFSKAIAETSADIVTANHLYYYDDRHPRRFLRNVIGVVPYTGERKTIDVRAALRAIYAFERRGAGSAFPRFHFSATVIARRVVEAAFSRLGFVMIDDMPNIHSLQPIVFAFAKSGFSVDHPVVIIGRLGVSMSQTWSTAARGRFRRRPFVAKLSPVTGYARINGTLENFLRVQELLPDLLGDMPVNYERFAELYLAELALLDTGAGTAVRNWKNLFAFLQTLSPAAQGRLLPAAHHLALRAPLVYLSRRTGLHHVWRTLNGWRIARRERRRDFRAAIRGNAEFAVPIDPRYGVTSVETLALHLRDILFEATGRDIFAIPGR